MSRQERALRRRNVARAITLAYDSLRTHLCDAVKVPRMKNIGMRGNEEWNSKCVREYAEVIYTLSVELHELAKVDFPETHEDFDTKP